jgi:hypothetical protein
MIREYESYHGAVLSRLLHSAGGDVTLRAIPEYGNVAYLVNKKTVLYTKYSSKRLSPWSFSFNREHHADVIALNKQYGSVVLALVCGDDGVVAIDFDELQNLLGRPAEKGAWIRCSRMPREMYAVKGSAGSLDAKIGDGHLIEKLRASLAIV